MAATPLIPPNLQFISPSGAPYALGTLSTFEPGTFVPKTTWLDANKTVANPTIITLNASGFCVAWGDGDYRLILHDADGNQIFDELSTSPLPSSAISAAMLPVVGASTLALARQLMGIDAEIAGIIDQINLMPGVTGATGPTGPQGPIGPTGPTGESGVVSFSMSNPGYMQFGVYGNSPLFNFGFSASDSSGHATVSFARTFTTTCIGVNATCVAPEGVWCNPTSVSNGGFSAVTMSPYGPGSTFFGPIGFFWYAIGM